MDAIQRNTDVASRFVGAAQDGNATAKRREAAAAETPAPAGEASSVTLSRRAQEMAAARKVQESDATAAQEDQQAQVQQMSLLNAQLRRAYAGAEGSGGAG